MKADLHITFMEDKKQMSNRNHGYLKNKGVTRAVVENSGSGDSGCIDHTAVYIGEDPAETEGWDDFPIEGICSLKNCKYEISKSRFPKRLDEDEPISPAH